MSRGNSHRARPAILIGAVLLGLALVSCASRSYAPESIARVGFLERAQAQEAEGLLVRAAVPSAEESLALFGIPVYERGIQPVWVEVTNGTLQRVRFAPVGVDRTYFAPFEVAYMHKGLYAKDAYAQLERRLHETAMKRWVWPGETRSGFVFTHFESGTKAFNIDVFEAGAGSASFSFFINVPGFEPDHADVQLDSLYAADEIRPLDEAGLRAALEEPGICTTDAGGSRRGLPLNVVLVGAGDNVLKGLLRSGFFERPRAELPADFEKEQHWRGRPPDALFRTARERGTHRDETNELRIWLSPMTLEGEPVWLAQITHFVGRPSALARALFDPRVDPDMDDARLFLLQRLWYSQALEKYAWQDSGDVVALEEERADFRGVVYFTTGVRAVLWPSGRPISQGETRRLDWDPVPVSGGNR